VNIIERGGQHLLVLDGAPPREQQFSVELLETGAPYITEEDGHVWVRVDNAQLCYEITARSDEWVTGALRTYRMSVRPASPHAEDTEAGS
jgi:hypothetical protein